MCRPLALFYLLFALFHTATATSWQETKVKKSGQLDLYWFSSLPFIYEDNQGQLTGLEYEILHEFSDYLAKRYEVDLKLNWKESTSFSGIMQVLDDLNQTNVFGVSAFSITDERLAFYGFTKPYMPDITVLVTSKGTPIASTYEKIYHIISEMEAVTIKGTTYDSFLKSLKTQSQLDFKVLYIESDKNILQAISQAPNRFGFIDLPIYLMLIRNGGELTRQNLFTIRGTGYGFIMPITSDWDEPFNEFLEDSLGKAKIAEITAKYLGPELQDLINQLSNEDPLGTTILTKEKEIQFELIRNANLKLAQEKRYKQALLFGIGITFIFLIVIAILYFRIHNSTKLLLLQKEQIEEQREDIRLKNERLVNRNEQLIALNEEKNNLVRILAHDLRSPLSQIVMVAEILRMSKKDFTQDERDLLNQIGFGATRIDQMITKILDVEAMENNQALKIVESVVVYQVCEELVTRYLPTAEIKGISLTTPKVKKKLVLKTNPMLLSQILENLLSNAIKFSPSGGTVVFEAEEGGGGIIFKISDQGPGFTEEDKLKMYARFQKLSAQPTGNESSTGLGLSIVKRYVSDLGGKVWLESVVGQGTTFFVGIPYG